MKMKASSIINIIKTKFEFFERSKGRYFKQEISENLNKFHILEKEKKRTNKLWFDN